MQPFTLSCSMSMLEVCKAGSLPLLGTLWPGEAGKLSTEEGTFRRSLPAAQGTPVTNWRQEQSIARH